MNNKYKNILFLFFLFVLFIPLIEMNLNLFNLKPLKGSFTVTEKPDLIKTNWFSEKYQIQYDKYFNDHLGFRNILVRINNQIQFSLFKKINTDNAIIGKDNFILDEKYIFEHIGLTYIGQKYLSSQVKRLDIIQYYFKKHFNIEITLILAPSKVSYYNNKIPDYYLQLKRDSSTYETLRNELLKTKINLIDFNKWFDEIKDTSKHELFPKYGIHWSGYGYTIAADSLAKYISKDTNFNIPKIYITDITKTDSVSGSDKDIESSMNILFPLRHLKMSYPIIRIENIKNKNLKLLAIGDSYYNGFINSGIIDGITTDNEFYYYNKTKKNGTKIDFHNYISNITKYNYIIILNTEMNYWNFGNGFIEYVYSQIANKNMLIDYYTNNLKYDSITAKKIAKYDILCQNKYYKEYKQARIDSRQKYLYNSIILRSSLITKAKTQKVNLEQMAYKDAKYLYKKNLIIDFSKEDKLESVKKKIKNNTNWYLDVKQQASERNITIDSMLTRAALYYLKNK